MNDIVTTPADPFGEFSPAARLPVPAAARSEATKIEQSRAVAEVQAAVVVAHAHPRNVLRAIEQMRQSCQIQQLAERAFFRFPRAGQQISGASVHLARELARCWGNIDYGVKELDRDDAAKVSEMLAYAWDLETNARSATTFLVPHTRDTKSGQVELKDARDVYENNANMAARRLRECIFAVLPPWYAEEAKDICFKTMRDGGGRPLETRIADAVKAFDSIGVSKVRIERKLATPIGDWTAQQVATLGVIFKSVQRGEMTVSDEFPTDEPPNGNGGGSRLDALEQQLGEKSPDKKPRGRTTKAETAERKKQEQMAAAMAGDDSEQGSRVESREGGSRGDDPGPGHGRDDEPAQNSGSRQAGGASEAPGDPALDLTPPPDLDRRPNTGAPLPAAPEAGPSSPPGQPAKPGEESPLSSPGNGPVLYGAAGEVVETFPRTMDGSVRWAQACHQLMAPMSDDDAIAAWRHNGPVAKRIMKATSGNTGEAAQLAYGNCSGLCGTFDALVQNTMAAG